MKLNNIVLHNFRRFESAQYFFDPNFTVLIGVNGKGKTTILDGIAIMLGTYFQGAGTQSGQGAIKKDDARKVLKNKEGLLFYESEVDVSINALGEHEGREFEWIREVGDRGGKARELTDLGKEHRTRHNRGEDFSKPLFLYYGAGRLWDAHRNVGTEKPKSQLDAYRNCLNPKSDQKAFEKWFRKLTYSKLQKQSELPALDAVKNAVVGCIPGCAEFIHDTHLDEILITLGNDEVIPFNLLSDGYRNMVAMVADIAHRAAKLNPHLGSKAATETSGIVLIDEIDLHLHPKWQRQVVSDLRDAFPNIQFIASTHSPFIIQSLEPGEVIDLEVTALVDRYGNEDVSRASPGPLDSYSNRSIEDITEEVMGVPIPQRSQRYQEMFDAAKKYYALLEHGAAANESEKAAIKQRLDELSAPFSENVGYHAFLEMERIASGLGATSENGGQL